MARDSGRPYFQPYSTPSPTLTYGSLVQPPCHLPFYLAPSLPFTICPFPFNSTFSPSNSNSLPKSFPSFPLPQPFLSPSYYYYYYYIIISSLTPSLPIQPSFLPSLTPSQSKPTLPLLLPFPSHCITTSPPYLTPIPTTTSLPSPSYL